MAPTPAQRKRRSDWRGERTPVLVRLPGEVAERLAEEAEQQHCSLSEAATRLITGALGRGAA